MRNFKPSGQVYSDKKGEHMDKYIKEMFNDVRKFCGDLKNALVASIEDTGWIRLNTNVVYRRKNGVVYVNGAGAGNATLIAGTYVTVGTLPAGFRPSRDVVGLGIDGLGASGMDFTGLITPAGEIKIYSVSNTNYWRVGASFPIGGGRCITAFSNFLRGGVCYG